MNFIKTIQNKEIVLVINKNNIDDDICNKILSKVKNSEKIGLDMKNVQNICSKKFIACLLNDEFKLFNLQSEVLTYLAIILKNGFLKSYINYEDFSKNKRELIKRRLHVI